MMIILKMEKMRPDVEKLALDLGLTTPRHVYSLSAGEVGGWENIPGPGWGFRNTSSYSGGQFS